MRAQPETWAAAGWVVAALSLIGLLLRMVGPWRKQITEAEERLRRELFEQLEAEKKSHAEELRTHRLERDEMGDRIALLEKRLERQQAKHNAERALDRHRLNNINQCFDALLLLIETSPERATEIVSKIKEMRASQLVAEAEEKAIIRAAEIESDEVTQ